MEALRRIPAAFHILASPEDCAGQFIPLAEEAGFSFFPGPKEDVLSRYCLAIRRFSLDRVIRACADNPFVFTDAAGAVHVEAQSLGADYAAYSGLPYGAGVESVSAQALLRAERESAPVAGPPAVPGAGPSLPPEREHVCPYLYQHPELFLLHRPLAPRIWQGPSIRLSVDTREDYDRAVLLWDALAASFPRDQGNGGAIIAVYRKLAAAGRRAFQEPG
jgi:spore coat polysaccharide biosynthesis protein SpsF